MADLDDFHLFGVDPGELIAALDPVALVLPRPSWQREAACRGVGVASFFGTPQASTEAADALCAVCSVAGPCLDYALENDLAGYWASTSERARRKLRRVRRAEAA